MNQKLQSKGKTNNGITLIALVITIIVLLILAGVSIATLTGENGILTQANDAKVQSIIGEEKEAINLSYTACKTNDYTKNVTAAELQGELEKIRENGQVSTSGNNLIVWFKDTNHRYTVDQNGKIEQIEDSTPEEENKIVDVYGNFDSIQILTADGTVKFFELPYKESFENKELKEIDINEGTIVTENGVKKIVDDCLVDGEGKVYTWGYNTNGQIGNGEDTEKYYKPICISDIDGNILKGKNIIDVYSNETNIVALDDEGKVYAWGSNWYGQLGNGEDYTNSNVPICISDISTSVLKGKKITNIYLNYYGVIALDDKGKVYTWGGVELGNGTNEKSNIPICISDISTSALNGKKIVDINLNDDGVIALDNNGKVYTWGYMFLGDGTTNRSNWPICISDISENVLNGRKIIDTRLGENTVIVLDSDGKVYTWGGGETIGYIPEKDEYLRPICISDISESALNGKKIKDIKIYETMVMALDENGKVYTWGSGPLGKEEIYNSQVPICINDKVNNVLNNKEIVEIGLEGNVVRIMDKEGKLYAWRRKLTWRSVEWSTR